jgi:hypothetical protein
MFPAHTGGKRDLTFLERLVLSVALSVVIVAIVGLILEWLGHFEETPFVVSLLVFVTLVLVLAIGRSMALPEDQRWPAWQPKPLQTSTIALGILAVATLGALVGFMASPKDPVTSTQIGLIGPDGGPSCYPAAFLNGTYYATVLNNNNGTVAEGGCPVPADLVTFVATRRGDGSAEYTLNVYWATGTGTSLVAEQTVATQALTLPSKADGGLFTRQFTLTAPPSAGDHFLVFQLYEGQTRAVADGARLPHAEYEVRLAIAA